MIPTDVETFCKWFRYTRANRNKELENPRVKFVRFEDLIYKYEETVEDVEKWLNLSVKDHIRAKKCFVPAQSINNTQVWEKYDCDKNEIKYIEKNLSKYLYDFPSTL